MRRGTVPSVAEAAEAAEVSRATAYRYFPSQSALVEAAIADLMERVPTDFEDADPVDRVGSMARRVVGLTGQEEALLRAALRLELEQWAQQRAEGGSDEQRIVRGGRRASIAGALAPAGAHLDPTVRARLEAALAVVVGIEARVVLTDICGLDEGGVKDVIEWAATTLAREAFDSAE